jgi:subtilisin family serine protease
MLSRRQALRKKRALIAMGASVLLGLIISALIISPPISRARINAPKPPADFARKQAALTYVPGRILVRYRSDVIARRQQSAQTALKIEGRSVAIQIEHFMGSDVIDGLRLVHVAPEETLPAIAELSARSEVLYAEPDYILHTAATPNDPRFTAGDQYGLLKISAPAAWDTTTGSSSVVVGVIDEGIDVSHQDLQANIWTNPSPGSIPGISGDVNGYDFLHNTGVISPDDHATHVAGIIGAVGNNGVGVVGVNWQVRLMSLKILGGGTSSSLSDAIRACSYAKQERDLWVSSGGSQGANVRVLNNSWTQLASEGFSQALFDSINALNQSGILFVAAAGNFPEESGIDNDLNPLYPAGYPAPNIIAVASTDQTDTLFSGSHYGGNTVHLGAPGVGILSTTPGDHYAPETGTSMATPHVAGAAALLLAAKPNLTVQQLKDALLLNGDVIASLTGKTITGRRLNVSRSLNAINENDVIAPGTVTNFQVTSQTGRNLTIGWTPSGDDGTNGQAALYQVSFKDQNTDLVIPLKSVVPSLSGTPQSISVKLPYAHTKGTLTLREFDNVGNEGVPATTNVSIPFVDGDPYAKTVGANSPLTTGGTHLNLSFDDRYLENYPLPFPFPFFGTNYNSVTISTNGNLYFQNPGQSDPDFASSVDRLSQFKMIAGLWDDLYLGTDQRFDADVYDVRPNGNSIIFRWQGVPCNAGGNGACTFGGAPVNFEIELNSNGQIQSRYGSGNTALFPVVGISTGELDPYVFPSHTSEHTPKNLTNAQTVTYIPRDVINPLDNPNFFVSQHYRDFLSREPDAGGLVFWSEKITGNAGNSPPPCSPGDTACINARRIGVSDAFFVELEYQQTASFVYRVYRESFGNNQPFSNGHPDGGFPGEDLKIPNYQVFAADRALVVGGSNLAQLQLDFANAFVQRPAFIAKYPASLATADQFVDAILATLQNDIGVNLSSERTALITLYNSGGRGAVVYRLADDNVGTNPINNRAIIDAEYNRAFVFGEYGGYLRRNSDIPGFMFWLGQVNGGPLRDIAKQHAMVCSFITSAEYQQRFSALVTHNNTECQ